MSERFAESVVEDAALAWLESQGCAVLLGSDIAVGGSAAERTDAQYRDVVLESRFRAALDRLNPDLPEPARGEAVRRLPS